MLINKNNLFFIFYIYAIAVNAEVKDYSNLTQNLISQIKEKPLILDFYSDNCPPCKKMKPIIEELSKSHANKYLFGKIDIDKSMGLAEEFYIRSVPTFVIIQNGKVAGKFSGACPMRVFIKKIDKILADAKNTFQ